MSMHMSMLGMRDVPHKVWVGLYVEHLGDFDFFGLLTDCSLARRGARGDCLASNHLGSCALCSEVAEGVSWDQTVADCILVTPEWCLFLAA